MFDAHIFQQHDYAVIDRLAVDALPDGLPLVSFAPPALKNDVHLLPVLLPLRELGAEHQATLAASHARAVAAGQPLLCTTLLTSTVGTAQLQAHLAGKLVVRLSDGADALLRYYDPRVFVQLQWMLGPRQVRALFGPVTTWTVHLDGAWTSTSAPTVDRSSWWFDAQTSARLERSGLINETIACLPKPLAESRSRLGQQIDRLLVHAKGRYQFQRDEDLTAFAAQAINVHRAFDRHPTIQALIARLAEERQSYADATALLDEADWRRIGAEMNAQERNHP
jgi:hypothetical protein